MKGRFHNENFNISSKLNGIESKSLRKTYFYSLHCPFWTFPSSIYPFDLSKKKDNEMYDNLHICSIYTLFHSILTVNKVYCIIALPPKAHTPTRTCIVCYSLN